MTEKTYEVVGIGNAIVDIIARCDEGFLTKHDLDKGFMRLIDADEAGRLYEAMGPAIERSGGSVANSIAGLASFGAKCGFIGRVAADQFGGIFRHDIRSLGIGYTTEPAVDGAPTARCLVLVTPDGERTMNTFLGASVDFSPGDIDAEMIGAARIVYLEGYLFDKDEAKAAFRQGGVDPLRPVLCRPSPVRFPQAGQGGRRYRLRQREGDHHPLRGEFLR
jgi:sugar/nucleoside kinase (ribokinase family)